MQIPLRIMFLMEWYGETLAAYNSTQQTLLKNASRTLVIMADVMINDCPWGCLVYDMIYQTYCALA